MNMQAGLQASSVLLDRASPQLALKTYGAVLASDEATRLDAFRLRYKCYLAGGHIEPREDELFRDIYDDMPNARTIVLYEGEEPVGSVRTSFLRHGNGWRSPGRDVFGEVFEHVLAERSFAALPAYGVEVTRMVRSPAVANDQGITFLLYRLAGYVGLASGAQHFFACVRHRHRAFYQRFGYRVLGEAAPYPGLNCTMQPMTCSRANYNRLRARHPIVDPFAASTANIEGLLSGDRVHLAVQGVVHDEEAAVLPRRPGALRRA